MRQSKLKRYFGFPLEGDTYRQEIEHNLADSLYRMAKVVCSLILVSQIGMMLTMMTRKGGPFASPRRQAYWWMYFSLFVVTLISLLYAVRLQRRRPERKNRLLWVEAAYAGFICLWGCGITIIDQMGGNSIHVYSYVTLSVAAFAILKPWQGLLIFGGSCLFLNVFLPFFPSGRENLFNNLVNSLFITILAFLISTFFYRNKVFGYRDQIIIQQQMDEIRIINERLTWLAMTDELTQMNNRRYLEKLLQEDGLTEGQHLTGMMVDIDYFKQFNDTYGHIAGDHCLQNLAKVILSFVQDRNACAVRYGGEEFFICLFDCDAEEAVSLAESLRTAVQKDCLGAGTVPAGCMSVSIGVGEVFYQKEKGLEELIHFSDRALYQAKEQGRNRVVLYSEEPGVFPG